MKYIAYVDASIKSHGTYHSYYIMEDGKIIVGRVFSTNINRDVIEAEAQSVRRLLQHCAALKIRHIQVRTDCRGILPLFEGKLFFGKIKVNMEWIPREKNTLAHKACRSEKTQFFKKYQHQPIAQVVPNKFVIQRRQKVPPKTKLFKGYVQANNVSLKEKQLMYQYYVSITGDKENYSVDDILEWIKDKPSINTKKGRRYIVEQFVQYCSVKIIN